MKSSMEQDNINTQSSMKCPCSEEDNGNDMQRQTILLPSPSTCQVPDEHCPRDEKGNLVKIHGLEYYKNFLSNEEQEKLLDIIYENPWQQIIARRQQFYGQVYYHTSQKLNLLQPSGPTAEEQDNLPHSLNIGALLPLLKERCLPFFKNQGFPSQVLVNEYRNNLGIASHFEDFGSFGPVILTLSLKNPIYMTLKKPKIRNNSCDQYHDIKKILLEPGSLLVMKDEARNDYRHGISKYKWIRNLPDGRPDICRDGPYRRVSLTIRHILSSRRKVAETEDESDGWRYRNTSSAAQPSKFIGRP